MFFLLNLVVWLVGVVVMILGAIALVKYIRDKGADANRGARDTVDGVRGIVSSSS
jgi:cytochrome c-type biogenesis protein CcmH/NrfF